MTQEERLLVYKDLCARQPYKVRCSVTPLTACEVSKIRTLIGVSEGGCTFESKMYPLYGWESFTIKPYLRPISSMTKEEVAELITVHIISKYGSYSHYRNIISIDRPRFDGHSWDAWVSYETVDGERQTCFGIGRVNWETTLAEIDWLNEHHFDYRGLIKKGLALEAPVGMYNINKE